MARWPAAAGMVRGAHQQQYRRIEPDVGVLSCASASRSADRGAAQVTWRDYFFFSAPQLKRDPLDSSAGTP